MRRTVAAMLGPLMFSMVLGVISPARAGTLGEAKQVHITSTRTVGSDGGVFCANPDDFRRILKALYNGTNPDPVPKTCRKVAPGGSFTTKWLSWIDEGKGLLTSQGTLGAEPGYFVGQLSK